MMAASRRQIFSMKIGITTFQWSENYGAVLQAHALQFFLRERGHDVQIVDYRPRPQETLLHKWIAKTPRGCVRKWEAAYKTNLFEDFRKKHLVRTPDVFQSSEELSVLADRFDVLITGSDQVWNPQWLSQVKGFFDLYFLSFAGPQTRRISYAASFGHSEKATMKSDWQKIIGEKLKKLDAISVREASGVELVRDLCGRTDAVQVVDPTLLLSRTHYEKLMRAGSGRKRELFCYVLHGMEQDAGMISRQIAESLNLNVARCDAHKTALHAEFTLPSPTGWLRRIRDAAFMVTNSFHGVVFCLILHTPFVALLINGQLGSMNSRIIDLLKAVGLSSRIVSVGGSLPGGIVDEEIDWDEVDRKLIEMRKGSASFLTTQGL
jgi:hypothetical protein